MKIKFLIKESHDPVQKIIDDARKISKEFLTSLNLDPEEVRTADCPVCHGQPHWKCNNKNCDHGWDEVEDDLCSQKCSKGWKGCENCALQGRLWDVVMKRLKQKLSNELWEAEQMLTTKQGSQEIGSAVNSVASDVMREMFGKPQKHPVYFEEEDY